MPRLTLIEHGGEAYEKIARCCGPWRQTLTTTDLAKSVTVDSATAWRMSWLFAPNESVPRPLVKPFRGGGQNSLKAFLDKARNAFSVLCVLSKKSGLATSSFESNSRGRTATERFFSLGIGGAASCCSGC